MCVMLLLLLLFTLHLCCFLFLFLVFPSLFLPSYVPSSSSPVFSLPLASSSVIPFLLSLLLLFLLLCLFSLFPRVFHLFSLSPLLPRLPLSSSAFSSSCLRFRCSSLFFFFFFPLPLSCFLFFLIMVLLLSLLLSLLLLLLPFVSSSCFFFCAYLFFSRSFCSSSSFLSSLGSSFCSPAFLFLFGSFFSSLAVSSYCLLFRCSFLFACSASLISTPPFPSAPVEPPRGLSASHSFPKALLFFRSFLFSFLGLLGVLRSCPLLPRGPSGVLPYIFFVLLFSFFFSGCGWVLRYSRLRCSVSLRPFRRWIVGLWPPGVRLFALLLLFAILLSFLVFVMNLFMVLLAFYLLCLSLLRSLILTLWLLVSLCAVAVS